MPDDKRGTRVAGRPAFIGRDISDRSSLIAEMAHRFHIHGRTGPVVYALSAIEIALWDIAGKLVSLPIASLLGGAPRELTAYACLLRYAEPELMASAVERAVSQGFRHLKLHEGPRRAGARARLDHLAHRCWRERVAGLHEMGALLRSDEPLRCRRTSAVGA